MSSFILIFGEEDFLTSVFCINWKSQILFFFFNNFIYSFIFGCGGSCCCTGLFSIAVVTRGYSSLQCAGRAQALGCVDFTSCGMWALERRLSSHGAWAWLFCRTGNLPGPGIEPLSPPLDGGFFTTEPPEKPPKFFLFCLQNMP